MKRHRVIGSVLFLTTIGIAMVAACSFPELSFAPDGGDDQPETGTEGGQDGGPDARDGSTESGTLPPDVDPEGGIKEAGTADVIVVDAAGGCCDCDMDTYILDGGADGSCVTGGAAPNSGDCDDTIGVIHPGANFALNTTWPPSTHTPAFDWDCDGKVTKQLNYNLNCGGLVLLGLGCSGEGFQDDPACGVEANYVKCVVGGLLGTECNPSSLGKRTQACR